MSSSVKPLPADALYTRCDPDQFGFETTAELAPVEDVIGQNRAVEAVHFVVGMRHDGCISLPWGRKAPASTV